MKTHQRCAYLAELETWADNPDHRAANEGDGMCNTGARWPTVCERGGIGCNVNHALIRATVELPKLPVRYVRVNKGAAHPSGIYLNADDLQQLLYGTAAGWAIVALRNVAEHADDDVDLTGQIEGIQ